MERSLKNTIDTFDKEFDIIIRSSIRPTYDLLSYNEYFSERPPPIHTQNNFGYTSQNEYDMLKHNKKANQLFDGNLDKSDEIPFNQHTTINQQNKPSVRPPIFNLQDNKNQLKKQDQSFSNLNLLSNSKNKEYLNLDSKDSQVIRFSNKNNVDNCNEYDKLQTIIKTQRPDEHINKEDKQIEPRETIDFIYNNANTSSDRLNYLNRLDDPNNKKSEHKTNFKTNVESFKNLATNQYSRLYENTRGIKNNMPTLSGKYNNFIERETPQTNNSYENVEKYLLSQKVSNR